MPIPIYKPVWVVRFSRGGNPRMGWVYNFYPTHGLAILAATSQLKRWSNRYYNNDREMRAYVGKV